MISSEKRGWIGGRVINWGLQSSQQRRWSLNTNTPLPQTEQATPQNKPLTKTVIKSSEACFSLYLGNENYIVLVYFVRTSIS